MFRLLLMTKPRSRYHEFFWPLQKTSNLEKYADIIMYCHILILDFRVQFSQWKDYPNWLIYFNSYCIGPPIGLLAIAIKILVKTCIESYWGSAYNSFNQNQNAQFCLRKSILQTSPPPDFPPCTVAGFIRERSLDWFFIITQFFFDKKLVCLFFQVIIFRFWR